MNQQFQMAVPLTPVVKKLIIINCVIWVGAVLILQNLVLGGEQIFDWFALVPYKVVTQFWAWQLFTYMFLHSNGVFHILFNMLSLWWFGSELEQRWGPKFFLTYYLVCGVGAGLIYMLGTLGYYLVTDRVGAMAAPLVGASGATYGLLLAYGILFGERMIFFMMLFPMKAKYFTLIIGLVELVTLLDSGIGSQVANLAHLGGIAVGFLFLNVVARWRARSRSGATSRRGRRLKLVVNNERDNPKEDKDGPKYWN
jgi:membrane associated rhomboid family serine protease